ncbi:MAG: hypothetical protein R3B84_06385 [Zavarzinella sp.]
MKKLFALAFAVVFATTTFAQKPSEEPNPLKDAKVGDFAKYKMSMSILGMNIDMEATTTVVKKSEKEATLETEVKSDGNLPIPNQKQTQVVDLTKPLDPAKSMNLPEGTEAKIEKLKDGKEKIKVNGKEYDCTWETYKMKMKQMGMDIDADVKVWNAKGFKFGSVKMEMKMEVLGNKMDMTMELIESGSGKKGSDD